MEEFVTKVLFDNYENKGRDQVVEIKWTCEFEMRSWGIKGAYIKVPNQKFSTIVEDEDGSKRDVEYEIKDCFIDAPTNCQTIAPLHLYYEMTLTNKIIWRMDF